MSNHGYEELRPRDTRVTLPHDNFWVKNDFLGISEFLSYRTIQVFYGLCYLALALTVVTFIGLLFPSDITGNAQSNLLLNSIDSWNKATQLRRPLPSYDLSVGCVSDCFFHRLRLDYQTDFNYLIDKYHPSYAESFFAASPEESTPFAYDEFKRTYPFLDRKTRVEVSLGSGFGRIGAETGVERDMALPVVLRGKESLTNLSLVKGFSQSIENKCRKISQKDCSILCEQNGGVLNYINQIPYCIHLSMAKMFCWVVDFESKPPVLLDGCFTDGSVAHYVPIQPTSPQYLNETVLLSDLYGST